MKRNYNRYYKSLNPQLAKNPSDKFRSDTESDLDNNIIRFIDYIQ